jgi:hypothetical protein
VGGKKKRQVIQAYISLRKESRLKTYFLNVPNINKTLYLLTTNKNVFFVVNSVPRRAGLFFHHNVQTTSELKPPKQ